MFEEASARGYALAVVGIPKTIDNDVRFVSRTFGHGTAVAEAVRVIQSAHNEARSVDNGVAVVKLMGRHAGFIAAAATVASQDVNFCLVPEERFSLGGPGGLWAVLERRLARKGHAVVVVAEGAGQHLLESKGDRDASGNVKLQDIGLYLKDRCLAHFRELGMEMNLRYFDPGYEIRSCPANTEDALLCDRMGRHAVHAAMAGNTAMLIGRWHGRFVHVPMALATRQRRHLDTDGDLWMSVMEDRKSVV